jgi:Fic family protein
MVGTSHLYVEISGKSRRIMAFDPEKPYNSLLPMPPKAELDSKPILNLCISAGRALEGLKQIGKTIPNESVLINTIPLLEAQASSEIENIVTTTDQLFRFADADEQNADNATKEALRYRTALQEGGKTIKGRPLNVDTAIRVCQTVVDDSMDVRNKVVRMVKGQEVVYTPPEGQRVLRNKLENWVRFMHDQQQLDPLIRMAAGHYQFEAIHPFNDGNGRTGRILNILYLVDKRLLDVPVLYLSRFIIENKSDYYRLLLEVTTEQRWQEWIEFMLLAVEATALWTRNKIVAIRELQLDTARYVSQQHAGLYSHELVEQLFMQPYIRIGNLVDAQVGHRETVSKYLKELVDDGMLEERKVGREKLFLNIRFLKLIQAEYNQFEPYPH